MHRKEQIAVGGVVLVVVRIFSLLYKRRKAHKKTQGEIQMALQLRFQWLAKTVWSLDTQALYTCIALWDPIFFPP